MAFESWDYRLDFNGQANEAPWVETDWSNYENSFAINTNGLRPNGFVVASSSYADVFTSDIRVGITIITNASAGSDPLGPALWVESGANAGKGYIFWCNGGTGSIRRRDTATGTGSNIGSPTTFTITSPTNGDQFWITYNPANGDIGAWHNGTQIATVNDTTYQSESFVGGIAGSAENNNGRRIGEIGIDGISSGVTIVSTPSDIRVTSSRTIRVTAPTTAMTTVNTTVKINDSGNDPITPSAVSNISGLTYDVVFTVPDTYEGIPYSGTGYPIIVTTADGSVTSGNVDFLPVTGNDFVVLTAAPGDFGTSLGTLAIGDIIDWETNGGEITVNSDGTITSTNPNTTFEARAWDATDSTYGAWALQTLGSGGGGSAGMTSLGLSESGLTDRGLTSSGLTS